MVVLLELIADDGVCVCVVQKSLLLRLSAAICKLSCFVSHVA